MDKPFMAVNSQVDALYGLVKRMRRAQREYFAMKSQRPEAHTDAMLDVMLDALNNAVERKNVVKPVEPEEF